MEFRLECVSRCRAGLVFREWGFAPSARLAGSSAVVNAFGRYPIQLLLRQPTGIEDYNILAKGPPTPQLNPLSGGHVGGEIAAAGPVGHVRICVIALATISICPSVNVNPEGR